MPLRKNTGWRFREWIQKEVPPQATETLPPGVDDVLGMRGTGGDVILEGAQEEVSIPGPEDEGVDRLNADKDLAHPPTEVLIRTAEERGVEGARDMDRATRLRHLRERLGA